MTAQEILFRKTSAIPSPSFGVFSLYKYPAKFIPQVPAFVMENYAKKGMREKTYVDRIVSRVMFRAKENPATGLEDQRMEREYLVVLRRR
jgi:hypothetical protein